MALFGSYQSQVLQQVASTLGCPSDNSQQVDHRTIEDCTVPELVPPSSTPARVRGLRGGTAFLESIVTKIRQKRTRKLQTITYEDALRSLPMCHLWEKHLERHNAALLHSAKLELPPEDRPNLRLVDLIPILDRRHQDEGKASPLQLVTHHTFRSQTIKKYRTRLAVTYDRMRLTDPTSFGLIYYSPIAIEIRQDFAELADLKMLTRKSLPNMKKAYKMLKREVTSTWTPYHEAMTSEAVWDAEHKTATKHYPRFDWLFGYEYPDGWETVS